MLFHLAFLVLSFFSWSHTPVSLVTHSVYLVTHFFVYLSNYPRCLAEVTLFCFVTYSSQTFIGEECVTRQMKSRRNVIVCAGDVIKFSNPKLKSH